MELSVTIGSLRDSGILPPNSTILSSLWDYLLRKVSKQPDSKCIFLWDKNNHCGFRAGISFNMNEFLTVFLTMRYDYKHDPFNKDRTG